MILFSIRTEGLLLWEKESLLSGVLYVRNLLPAMKFCRYFVGRVRKFGSFSDVTVVLKDPFSVSSLIGCWSVCISSHWLEATNHFLELGQSKIET